MIDHILTFLGSGLLWSVVLQSPMYQALAYALDPDERFPALTCPLCTGFWVGAALSLALGFHPLSMALVPLAAEMASRWLASCGNATSRGCGNAPHPTKPVEYIDEPDSEWQVNQNPNCCGKGYDATDTKDIEID
jgi:hypothetical protein